MNSWRGRSCASCSASRSEVEVVGQAGDGIEALGLIEDLTPDVVFLDVQMPGMNGFEVARQAIAQGQSPPRSSSSPRSTSTPSRRSR